MPHESVYWASFPDWHLSTKPVQTRHGAGWVSSLHHALPRLSWIPCCCDGFFRAAVCSGCTTKHRRWGREGGAALSLTDFPHRVLEAGDLRSRGLLAGASSRGLSSCLVEANFSPCPMSSPGHPSVSVCDHISSNEVTSPIVLGPRFTVMTSFYCNDLSKDFPPRPSLQIQSHPEFLGVRISARRFGGDTTQPIVLGYTQVSRGMCFSPQ